MKTGDIVVRLLSAQRMTVVAVYGDIVWCTWITGHYKHTEYFMADYIFKSTR